jgi:hypothetical protein
MMVSFMEHQQIKIMLLLDIKQAKNKMEILLMEYLNLKLMVKHSN